MKEDLRLLDGGLDKEMEIACYDESPTWIIDEAWKQVQTVCENSLAAYMLYCSQHKLPHSFLLGLDVLITAEIDPQDPRHLIDIRPTIMEGPCCNSYPACPNIDSYRLYKRAEMQNQRPDQVEYPTHPTAIAQKIAETLVQIYQSQGGTGTPRIGIFTRPYPESEEETGHRIIHATLLMNNVKAYRITPEEQPYVKDGRIWVSGVPMDVCYRRIERIHVPPYYGDKLGNQIIHETPDTIWVNPWVIDDLRSKTLEEKVFRAWEQETGKTISRGTTLLEAEITPDNVRQLAERGGFALKQWNSTGGRGVFLHVNHAFAKPACEYLYQKYDGNHMILLSPSQLEKELNKFTSFNEDASIQQLRFIDARVLPDGRLVYDTRINVLFQPLTKTWIYLSGISRVVKCGPQVTRGNTLLTNITSGAEISPLILGRAKSRDNISYAQPGPMLKALLNQQQDFYIP